MRDGDRDPASIHRSAIDWRLRIDDGLSSDERRAFEEWLAADPAHRRAYDEYAAMSRLAARLPRPERRRLRRLGLRPAYAAALLVAVGLAGTLLLTSQSGQSAQAAEVRNPGPSARSVRFVDGTVAVLDRGAFLLARIGKQERRITLKAGRARFRPKVAPEAPFVLDGGDGRVEVTDATFDAALIGDALVVTVVSGDVVLRSSAASTDLPLLAGQAGSVAHGDPERAPAPRAEELRWPLSRVAFDHAPLSDVVSRAAKLGGSAIVLEDEGLGRRQVTGVFDLRDARKLARILAAALDLTIREDGSRIVLGRQEK